MVTAFQCLHAEPDTVDSHGFVPCWRSRDSDALKNRASLKRRSRINRSNPITKRP